MAFGRIRTLIQARGLQMPFRQVESKLDATFGKLPSKPWPELSTQQEPNLCLFVSAELGRVDTGFTTERISRSKFIF